jgi:tetratricopeptide (TPR) repeat protein
MNFRLGLPAILVGISFIVVQPKLAQAISGSEVAKIAKSITVLIESSDIGSGVLLKREKNIYTVLTTQQTLLISGKNIIVTPDGKRYPVNSQTVKKLTGVNLALLQFTSDQTYSVAKIGDSSQSPKDTPCYVAGFPMKGLAITESIYNFTEGKITANATRPLKGGYALMYSNPTYPGMDGGPILNDRGELIGIHGQAGEQTVQKSEINPNVSVLKTEFNFGIPINTFLSLVPQVDKALALPKPPPTLPSSQLTADDFFLLGSEKFKIKDYRGAIENYDKAITLSPRYSRVHSFRGASYDALGDQQKALKDFNEAIAVDPKDMIGYFGRGTINNKLGNKQQALQDLTQAITLNPKFPAAYYNRGVVNGKLGNKQEAINDYTQAIALDPRDVDAYFNRGLAYYELGNQQQALKDYSQAIALNPKYTSPYINRGSLLHSMGDNEGAIKDYTQAITIDPKDVTAYLDRGNAHNSLKNIQEAIKDYTQVIAIDPTEVWAYLGRGINLANWGDKQGAIEDLQKAADLFKQQNNMVWYAKTLQVLQKLGQ